MTKQVIRINGTYLHLSYGIVLGQGTIVREKRRSCPVCCLLGHGDCDCQLHRLTIPQIRLIDLWICSCEHLLDDQACNFAFPDFLNREEVRELASQRLAYLRNSRITKVPQEPRRLKQ